MREKYSFVKLHSLQKKTFSRLHVANNNASAQSKLCVRELTFEFGHEICEVEKSKIDIFHYSAEKCRRF